jgi:hypothetical protein
MSRTTAHDDPPDRRPQRTWFAGALVNRQVLLHRAVAFGRGVVVDGAASAFDCLGKHFAQGHVESTRLLGAAGMCASRSGWSRARQRDSSA